MARDAEKDEEHLEGNKATKSDGGSQPRTQRMQIFTRSLGT